MAFPSRGLRLLVNHAHVVRPPSEGKTSTALLFLSPPCICHAPRRGGK